MNDIDQNSANYHQQIVFCDFDGTITNQETFVGMLKTFAPELAQEILPQIYQRKLSLKVGVRKILELMPSRLYSDILSYAKVQAIRPGLGEFLDFLQENNIPCIVISGGIKGMIETVLNCYQLRDKILDIWGVEIDTTQEYFQVKSPAEGKEEFVDKVRIMQQYKAIRTIAIGDGITDLGMALKTDLVFARDLLINYLETEKKAYIPWHDFFDVRNSLEELLNIQK